MYTDLRVQELYLQYAQDEQQKNAAMKDMIRIAKAGQPALLTRLRAEIGGALIATGEWIRRQPADLDRTIALGAGSRSLAR